MALHITQVHRNLHTRVTILSLELEDIFAILGLAVITNILGRFLHRELAGIPLNVLFQWIIPIAAIPVLMAFKYGKPRRYLLDFVEWHTKARIYCALERDSKQTFEYLEDGTCRRP